MSQVQKRMNLNGKLRTMTQEELTQAVHALHEHIKDLRVESIAQRQAASESRIREIAFQAFEEQRKQIMALASAAADALNLMIEAGIISQERVNATVGVSQP
jgi:ribosomal protein L29